MKTPRDGHKIGKIFKNLNFCRACDDKTIIEDLENTIQKLLSLNISHSDGDDTQSFDSSHALDVSGQKDSEEKHRTGGSTFEYT